MAIKPIKIIFDGDPRNALHSFDQIDKKAGGLTGKLKSVGKGLALGAAGIAAAGAAIAVKSASTFSSVAKDVSKIERLTGLTAEQASRLRFAANLVGVDTDKLTRSLGLFSKNLSGGKLNGLEKFGVNLHDARGQLLPTQTVLANVSDLFAKMPDGPQKTALAMQAFGRSGAELLPFLNKGAAGIVELEKQADGLGETLSQKDVNAMKDSARQSRLFHAGLEGLQIQIGRYVLPIITSLVHFLASRLPGAIQVTRGVMAKLGQVLGPPLMIAAKWISNATNQIGNLIAMFRSGDGDGQGFAEILDNIFGNTGKLIPFFRKLWDIGSNVTNWIKQEAIPGAQRFAEKVDGWGNVLKGAGIALAFLLSPLLTIAAGLVYCYFRFDTFRNVVDAVARWLTTVALPAYVGFVQTMVAFYQRAFQWLQTNVFPIVAQFIGSVIAKSQELIAWVKTYWPQISEAIGHIMIVIRDVIAVIVGAIVLYWQHFGDTVLANVRRIWNIIYQVIKVALTLIAGIIRVVVALINGDWGKAWDAIKQTFSRVWSAIGSIVKNAMGAVVNTIGAYLSLAKSGVSTAVDKIVGFFTAMPRRLAHIGAGMFDFIKGAFRSAIDWVIDKWNGLQFTLPKVSFLGHSVGGGTIGMPNIPRLHTGGVYDSGRGEGLALLKDGEGVFTPAQMRALGAVGSNGRGGDTIINLPAGVDPAAVVRAQRRYERRNGRAA